MECLTAKSRIEETIVEVSQLSNQKNEKGLEEKALNHFLDKILEFQNYIEARTNTINSINLKFQEFSWFENLDQECVDLLRKVLDLSTQWHSKLIRHYARLNKANGKFAKAAMKKLKIEIDDLKERNQDLEDLFFNLPADKEFTQKIQMLSK